MNGDAHDIDNEFVRDETTLDRDFLIVANSWVRDKRIVGNPLSIYLFVRSQAIGFRITRSSLMNGLGLGRSAFESAIAKLEQHGYLRRVEGRWPAGTRTAEGRQLGGTKRVYWHVLEPVVPAAEGPEAAAHEPPAADATAAETAHDPHEHDDREPNAENQHWVIHRPETAIEPNAENQHRVFQDVENPMRKTHGGYSASIRKQNLKKTNDHPAPPAAAMAAPLRAARAAGADDDDHLPSHTPEPHHRASADGASDRASVADEPDLRHLGVDAVELRRVLRAKLGARVADRLDLAAASRTVLERAVQAPVHPTRFVIAAIVAAPGEFLISSPTAGPGPTPPPTSRHESAGGLRGAVERLCAVSGHQWRAGPAGELTCRACELQADAISPTDRAACGSRPTGHRPDSAGICRDCGFDERADRAERAAAASARCAAHGHVWAAPMPGEPGRRLAGGYQAGDEPCTTGCGAVRRAGTIGRLELLASGARDWCADDPLPDPQRKVG